MLEVKLPSVYVLNECFVGEGAANERMQLTWLTGAPIQAGLGSPACRRAGRSRLTRHAADAGR